MSTNTNTNTHPVSVAHLVFGLVFLGTAGAWALGAAGVIEAGAARWILPLILILAGGAGLAASIAKSVSGQRRPDIDDPAIDGPGATDE